MNDNHSHVNTLFSLKTEKPPNQRSLAIRFSDSRVLSEHVCSILPTWFPRFAPPAPCKEADHGRSDPLKHSTKVRFVNSIPALSASSLGKLGQSLTWVNIGPHRVARHNLDAPQTQTSGTGAVAGKLVP